MKRSISLFKLCLLVVMYPFIAEAQDTVKRQLIWERNLIDLGTVMQENGEVVSEFFFVNKADFPIFIQEVVTDCGCTTVSYTTDTLSLDKIGSVKVSYEPTGRGGAFSKMIIVKTNIDSEGDSLFLEGYNLPYPEDIEKHYSKKLQDLGFNSTLVNMGNVFNNEPKVKQVDFYNFKNHPILLNEVQTQTPEHITVEFSPKVIPAKSRGLLSIAYDGAKKGDFGYFEDSLKLVLLGEEAPAIPLKVMAAIHEYFEPVPLSEVKNLPKLGLSETEVDLNRIKANMPVSKIIVLSNEGSQPLYIRKVASNCDCLNFSLGKEQLGPGERTELLFTFDPKGRRGIDHKTLSLFTNDPLSPTRSIIIKSRIE
ncbi:MAG TPA: DUF1573 domain-containing protein [Cyclobacteriaceae bacterium]|nr:DUF1573 domain-containing protein [Cyclobacteriaceae bacterium]